MVHPQNALEKYFVFIIKSLELYDQINPSEFTHINNYIKYMQPVIVGK